MRHEKSKNIFYLFFRYEKIIMEQRKMAYLWQYWLKLD